MGFYNLRNRRFVFLVLSSFALAMWPGTPARAEIGEALESPLARYLVTRTSAGRALTEEVLGYSVSSSTDPALLEKLRAPDSVAFAQELELRLRAAEARFRTTSKLGESEAIEALSGADRVVLERISSDVLATRLGAEDAVEFLSSIREGFAGAREAFLESEPLASKALSPEFLAELHTRYGVDPLKVTTTPEHGWPGVVVGVTPHATTPEILGPVLPHPGAPVDQVIVGSGPAGFTAGLVLSDSGQKVLILEAASKLGGLATGESAGGARFGAGAAYYAPPSKAQFRIFQRLGLNNYTKLNKIPNNMDSLLLDGVLYQEIWEAETLHKLPKSFKLYKYCLEKMDALGMIADQPIEAATDLTLDRYTAKEWVNKMPELVGGLKDAESQAVYKEFLEDPRVDPADPMRDVFKYLDPYGRSALGGTTDEVNAMAFFNFQLAELEPRYTGSTGTGEITDRFAKLLGTRPRLVSMQTSSAVARIVPHGDYVEVIYVKGGQAFSVKAKNVVYTAPMKIAPKLIPNFETLAPDHAQALAQIPYTDYIVTNVITDGRPTRGTYDFWFGNTDNKNLWVTDMIDGRFQETGITPRPNQKDDLGVLTLYQPKGQEGVRDFTTGEAMRLAENGIDEAQKMIGPYLNMTWGTEIKPKFVITNIYPASIQILKPGYFSSIAPVFRTPIAGRIYPAGIVTGTPSLEEAMYSGQKAAEAILSK